MVIIPTIAAIGDEGSAGPELPISQGLTIWKTAMSEVNRHYLQLTQRSASDCPSENQVKTSTWLYVLICTSMGEISFFCQLFFCGLHMVGNNDNVRREWHLALNQGAFGCRLDVPGQQQAVRACSNL